MQPGQTITITKSAVGQLLIVLAGILLTGLLAAAAWWLRRDGQTLLGECMFAAAVVAALGMAMQNYVYALSRIVLTDKQLTVTNWTSVIASDVAVCDWSQVQDVAVQKGGILPLLFDYGSLLIQTAGTERNLRINYIPKVEYWRDVIEQRADAAGGA
jgi:4-amino-4-deoxy-L-arabinose transferase-like glycosyltransferase